MKKYTPIKMIRAGRYKVCFDGLEPEIRADVLRRMETLITDNREWCDKGNYGHLCNILPTIAIDEAVQAHGKTADEAYEIISTHMWAALTPEMYIKLSRLPFFLSVMRKIIPLGFKYGSGKGWRYVWHPDDPKDRYHFRILHFIHFELLVEFFWCPEQKRLNCSLLSLTVCYFGLYNYLQIQIDTTKTGKTSERWPRDCHPHFA